MAKSEDLNVSSEITANVEVAKNSSLFECGNTCAVCLDSLASVAKFDGSEKKCASQCDLMNSKEIHKNCNDPGMTLTDFELDQLLPQLDIKMYKKINGIELLRFFEKCLSENVNSAKSIIKLQCCHAFHTRCIFQWFCKKRNNCPLCRGKISFNNFIDIILAVSAAEELSEIERSDTDKARCHYKNVSGEEMNVTACSRAERRQNNVSRNESVSTISSLTLSAESEQPRTSISCVDLSRERAEAYRCRKRILHRSKNIMRKLILDVLNTAME